MLANFTRLIIYNVVFIAAPVVEVGIVIECLYSVGVAVANGTALVPEFYHAHGWFLIVISFHNVNVYLMNTFLP